MFRMTIIKRSRPSNRLFLLAALAVFGLALVSAQPATAQGLPPICEDYPDLPQCELPDEVDVIDNEGGAIGGGHGDGDGDGAGAGTGDSNGNLPFTGYPMTPLLMLVTILVGSALAIRCYLAIRKRLAADRGPAY
jgi:hypothetical protein